MELMVDLSTGGVVLCQRDDFNRFAVRAVPEQEREHGGLGAVAAALSLHDAGTVDPDGDAHLSAAAVRHLAGTAAAADGADLDAGWEAGFAAMLAYAGTKGWITDDGSIRVHVEWGE
jgi:hypothetical protein